MAGKPVYHYTSVQALCEIVKSKRFRLSNVFFMNDYMEVGWCLSRALELLKGRSEERCDMIRDRIQKRGFENIFCGCFSATEDDLSQWRGYADDGRGVAIGVDIPEVVKAGASHGVRKYNVVYKVATQDRRLKEILDNYFAREPVDDAELEMLELAVTYLDVSWYAVRCKNPAFSGEQEVRLVLRTHAEHHRDITWHYDETETTHFPYGVDFHHRNGKLVPYAEVDFPLEAISEIWLGPRFGDEMQKVALQMFLSRNGVPDDVVGKIKRSTASYR